MLGSCQMEEKALSIPTQPDSVSTHRVVMGADYNNQVYVSLKTGQVKTVDNRSWDLCLDAKPKGFLMSMNGGTGVRIAETNDTIFKANINLDEVKWKWDGASGVADSLVLNNWCNPNTKASHNKVYIINRGLAPTDPNNIFQFKLIAVTDLAYTIEFADIHGNHKQQMVIAKDASKLNVYFSFADGGKALNFEPVKSDWHLCFLQYRWIYYEFTPPLLYQVSGVFINTSSVAVAVDSTLKFYDIKPADANRMIFKQTRDAIGYDWKVPIFNPTGVDYRTRDYVNYFVRVQNLGTTSALYKLRFIDFYDSKGVKGTPTFELKQLQ